MGSYPDSRSQELAQLQMQLADVSRLLDEIEKRSLRKRSVSESTAIDLVANLIVESPETRFAAYIASGMSKIRQPACQIHCGYCRRRGQRNVGAATPSDRPCRTVFVRAALAALARQASRSLFFSRSSSFAIMLDLHPDRLNNG
jgi:hypothetical protein